VLPAVFETRQEYVKKHPKEFCQESISWQESGGRMSQFYAEPAEDFYVGDSSNQCYSLGEWGCRTRKYLESNPKKWVWAILDLHGHFCAVRVYRDDYVGCSVLDTMANNENNYSSAVLALSRALSVERSESQQTHTSKD